MRASGGGVQRHEQRCGGAQWAWEVVLVIGSTHRRKKQGRIVGKIWDVLTRKNLLFFEGGWAHYGKKKVCSSRNSRPVPNEVFAERTPGLVDVPKV